MSNFFNAMNNTMNVKTTENGAFALRSTRDNLMDLFGTIGAMRSRSESDIVSSFIKAYGEDRLLAMKMLFYARDIREGLGERNFFKIVANYLANNHGKDIAKNLHLIAEYGRWDDMYVFVGTPLEKDAMEILKTQFFTDLENLRLKKPVSLLAKWLKSENASSSETKRLGRITAKYFYPNIKNPDTRSRAYRKDLSALRRYLDVVEVQMSANNWGKIDFEKVPSVAASNYKEAFTKHDPDRYNAFLNAVENGDAKINASAIFPYQIIKEYTNSGRPKPVLNRTTEEQWKAMPNFVTEDKDFLVVADVSGSMYGQPMDVSVSLAIYFAERNKGEYHGKFMTFSSKPTLMSLSDELTLRDKVSIVENADWGGSTNLKAVFDTVLTSAINGHLKQSELPAAVVVITDMEIDDYNCCDTSFTQHMREHFKAAGYEMPTIVWWNVNARENTFHGDIEDKNIRFISGCSPTIFKSLCENMGNTPEELMLLTLNSERYSAISIAE